MGGPVSGDYMQAVWIIKAEMADHGDGARALAAAESTGLSRHRLEQILWSGLSGKQGTEPLRVGTSDSTTPPLTSKKVWERAFPQPCPVCGPGSREIHNLRLHMRRQHPGVDL